MSCSDETHATLTMFPGQTLIKEEGSPTSEDEETSITPFPTTEIITADTIPFSVCKVKTEPASEDEQDSEQASTVEHPLGIVIKREMIEVDPACSYCMEGDFHQWKNSGDEDSGAETGDDSIIIPDCVLVKYEKDDEPDTEISEHPGMSELNEEMEKEKHSMNVTDKKNQCSKAIKTPIAENKAVNPCTVCGKVFDDSQTCIQHTWDSHTVKKTYSCKLCGKVFERIFDFKRHELSHTNARPFSCDMCDKSFKQKDHLCKHKKTCHSDERPFSCDQCDKSFKRKAYLDTHKALCHSDERPFSCDVCAKSFKLKLDVQRHKRICHSDERPFSCDLCNKGFKQKSDLHHHRSCHSDERPHSCDLCEKTFKRKPDLQNHKVMCHTNARPFPCDQCQKTFKRNSDLQRHKVCHSKSKAFLSWSVWQ